MPPRKPRNDSLPLDSTKCLDVPDGRLEHLIGHVIEIFADTPIQSKPTGHDSPVRFRVLAARIDNDLAIAGPIIDDPEGAGILYAASIVQLGSITVAVFLNARDVTAEYPIASSPTPPTSKKPQRPRK